MLPDGDSNIAYICYGKEIGEKKKIPHLQGYVELHKKGIFSIYNIVWTA